MLFLFTVRVTVSLILDALMLLMFLRAIMSWIPGAADNSVGNFLFTVTEVIISPVRALFDALGINTAFPIDIPFFVTFIVLSILGSIL